MQPHQSGSQRNSDLTSIRSWLLQLSRFCDTPSEKDLREKIECYSSELMDDVPISAFTKSTLDAARKRFTKFPSYPKLLEVLPVHSGSDSGDSAQGAANQRHNSLAYAAANKWLETHRDERFSAYTGGYLSDLQGFLVKEYFAKACAGMMSGSFEPGVGYVLDHVPSLRVPQWQIDSWVERESERKESRKGAIRGGSGFKRVPHIDGI